MFFPIAVGLFSILSSLMISVVRSGFGMGAAIACRYAAVTSLLIVAIILFLFSMLNHPRKKITRKNNPLFAVVLLIFSCFVVIAMVRLNIDSFERIADFHRRLEKNKTILLNYQSATDEELENLNPSPALIRKLAPFLKQNRLSLFCH